MTATLAPARQQTQVCVDDVRRRKLKRLLPALLVALVGIANISVGLFPRIAVELVDLTQPFGGRGILTTGRMASVELGLLLLLIARKLSQGSRSTWIFAVCLVALTWLVSMSRGHITIVTVMTLIALASLFATRSSYQLRRPGVRYSTRWGVAAVSGGLLLFAAVRYAQIDTALRDASLTDRLSILIRTTFFLPGGLDQESASFEALSMALRVGLVLVVIGVLFAFRPRAQVNNADRDATLEWVRQHGKSPTAPLLALPDNMLLTLCDGKALAAVGVRSGTAVCLGGPVAQEGLEAEALSEFTEYCEHAGWVPAMLGSDTRQRDLAAAAGYASLKIGVEAIIDVATFSTVGKRRSNVRHSVTRAGKEGVSVLLYAGSARTEARTAQLGRVSAQWLQDKGGPELGFTLGRFDPDRLDDQEVYVALLHEGADDERVVGFVTWLPYDQGRAAVLDLMRRAQVCPPGVMEMLIVESLADFKTRGRVIASLGGVPLAQVADGEKGIAQGVLAWTYVNGSSLYDARGLFRFKDKFDPRWEPMWLSYPSSAKLPRIALAAARAFLPPHAVRDMVLTKEARDGMFEHVKHSWASIAQRFAELDRAQRNPESHWVRVPIAAIVVMSSLLVAAVQTWESFALLPQFEEQYAWSAQYLLDGAWWRAVTATVITENAAAWVSLTVTTVLLLAILERMIGAVRAFLVYFIGAIWGYVGTTFFLLAGSTLGWDLATKTLETTDYGPSGGTAALGAAVVVLMRHRIVTVLLFGGLLVGSALHHQVADVQHLISYGTVVLLAYLGNLWSTHRGVAGRPQMTDTRAT